MLSDYIDGDMMTQMARGEGMCPTYDVWGIVTEASENTEKGNVRVKIKTMQDNQDIFDNVPVLTCYGGGEYGFFCLPEEGDVVQLTFPGGDFRHPVVTGCRFPADSAFAKGLYDKKNLKKAWQMKNGSAILFSGEKGKEQIEIRGSEKMRWRLDEEKQQIELGDQEEKNNIRVAKKDGKITVMAEKEICLECGESSLVLKKDGSITLSGKELTLESKTIQLQGRSKVQLKGQELAMEGTTGISIKAKGQIKAESKGALKLSGAMIHLN